MDTQVAGSTSVSGPVGQDTIEVGGLQVTQQAFGIPTQQNASVPGDSLFSGVFGLSFSSISQARPGPPKTFLENAAASLAKPVFSAFLPLGATASFLFGASDTSKFSGSLAFMPVDSSNGLWQTTFTGFFVGNSTISPSKEASIMVGMLRSSRGSCFEL